MELLLPDCISIPTDGQGLIAGVKVQNGTKAAKTKRHILYLIYRKIFGDSFNRKWTGFIQQ